MLKSSFKSPDESQGYLEHCGCFADMMLSDLPSLGSVIFMLLSRIAFDYSTFPSKQFYEYASENGVYTCGRMARQTESS